MTEARPSVVAIGGGHGTAVTLKAARRYAGQLTGVVSVADDGGSSGRLRELLNVVALGDIRKCLVALAERGLGAGRGVRAALRRGRAGRARAGQPDPAGADRRARATWCRACARRPSSWARRATCSRRRPSRWCSRPSRPRARWRARWRSWGPGTSGRVSLVPDDALPPPLAVERILEADQVVIGPGSLFTSVLAAVAVHGIAEAVAAAKAQVVYVCNLRPQLPETAGL